MCKIINNAAAVYLIIIISFISDTSTYAQNTTEKVIVIPGSEYEAGFAHRIFFGDHWRDLWTTPIEVEVLNLNTFAGGLTPIEKGGGQQTSSLKLKGNDGKEYRFRSVNKDITSLLPEELNRTVAEDVIQDQASTANPVAPLISAPIANAAGILLAQPHLYIMPDDQKLGKFRKEFARMLGMLEIHPDERGNDKPGFAGSEKIVDTYSLFEKLEEDNDNKVNAGEFLKARLIDIFIGDWDRHVDQWRWAVFEEDEFNVWYPIPKDRDQAFAKFTGLFPFITSLLVKRLESFSDEYGNIENLMYSGRYIDRRVLISLNKSEWDSVANFLTEKFTDSVIISAVKKMPPEMFNKSGEKLINDLKTRRDNLKKASDSFYKIIFEYVNIRGSNKHEHAEVKRLDDKNVAVTLFKKDNDTGILEKRIFNRVFNSDETCEIRLLLLDGDDSAIITGDVNSSIQVIVSGGKGDNLLIDSSTVYGSILGLIPDEENKTDFYVSNNKTKIIKGSGTDVHKEKLIELKDKKLMYEPVIKDYGHEWEWEPWLEINSDEGLVIGGGRSLYKYGYKSDPFLYKLLLRGAYATEPKRFRLDFYSKFYSIFENLVTNINFQASGLEVLNFYGFGNESVEDKSLKEKSFYEIDHEQFVFSPYLELPVGPFSTIRFGTQLKYVRTEEKKESLISLTEPYGVQNLFFQNFFTSFSVDMRNGIVAPTSGYYFILGASYFPQYSVNKPAFGKIHTDIRYYHEFDFLHLSSLALRAGGEKIWGTFPFFESAFLGGYKSLRGFEENRFAGNAAIFSSAELRTFLANLFLVIPVQVGFNILAETGRVFLKSESSNLWHNSYGGGILISFLKSDYTFNFSVVKSKTDIQYYLITGFAF